MNAFRQDWAQQLLDVLYENEYHAGFEEVCPFCDSSQLATYRCKDCFHGRPKCKNCMVGEHEKNPFHRVERWTGAYLEKLFMSDLGLIIYLGHSGERCCKAQAPVKTTIVHTNGIQVSQVLYCECNGPNDFGNCKASKAVQLLHNGLYAASFKRPQTAFSVAVFKQFHHMSMQSKVTAHDFYAGLRRYTNFGFHSDSKDRYREFMISERQYSFLRNLRWSHRRADESLSAGSLALECPACPQPDMNMDPNWRSCDKDLMCAHLPFVSFT